MNLTPEDKAIGQENFYAAIGSGLKDPRPGKGPPTPREKLEEKIQQGLEVGGVPGYSYFGYEKSMGEPLRVGVLGTGDEGSVLIGAINPDYIQVKAVADIRPYNRHRAFHGDLSSANTLKVRCGLMNKYEWDTEDIARQNVKVFEPYQELIANAKDLGIEAVIIALPLHLHKPAAIMAMEAGLHVLTEKLMAHSILDCKLMARKSVETGMQLATGHQRHYNILYEHSVELIKRGLLGQLHYIRAQWHRANRPGKDTWQKPMPFSAKKEDPLSHDLEKRLRSWEAELAKAKGAKLDEWRVKVDQIKAQIADEILSEKGPDGKILAEKLGYEAKEIFDGKGEVVYERPAIEELIRWRLWNRTGGGLMAELGSHQLDAASIFVSAVHGGAKQHPLNVQAAANRPLFPPDRDVDDHVACLFEFPAPDYDPRDANGGARKKIGVQYASINGNDYGGYGEAVFGTEGTLLLEKEAQAMLYKTSSTGNKSWVTLIDRKDDQGPRPGLQIDKDKPEKGDDQSAAIGRMAVKDAGRGYTQEMEHWASCIRHPETSSPLRCSPKVALADAVIALTTNLAAREERRIEFKDEWFDPMSDETPEKS